MGTREGGQGVDLDVDLEERRTVMEGGTAVITGATGGIGAVFASRLAERGTKLVLVARQVSKLEELASDLARRHGVSAEALPADLATLDGARLVEERVETITDLEILVNAAGFGTAGRFVNSDLATQLRMIELHVSAPTRLCFAALKPMMSRQRGAIINVSSGLAMLPLPYNVTYSGTKSYLLAFSQSLQEEVGSSGIRVQALCPGLTRTGFHHTAEYSRFRPASFPAFLWGTPEAVVDASLKALGRGQVVCIPGGRNKVLAVAARLGMSGLFVRLMARGRRRSR